MSRVPRLRANVQQGIPSARQQLQDHMRRKLTLSPFILLPRPLCRRRVIVLTCYARPKPNRQFSRLYSCHDSEGWEKRAVGPIPRPLFDSPTASVSVRSVRADSGPVYPIFIATASTGMRLGKRFQSQEYLAGVARRRVVCQQK